MLNIVHSEDIDAYLTSEILKHQGGSIVLAGGTTFLETYRKLAAHQDGWQGTHLFFTDERAVPPDHPDSNWQLIYKSWLHIFDDRTDGPTIHRVLGELPPEEAAAAYAADILAYGQGKLPIFDLVLLGMGKDGHTAGLFADSWESATSQPVAAAVPGSYPPLVGRITLVPAALESCQRMIVVVTGAGKALRVAEALTAGSDLPVSRLSPVGEKCWVLDSEAASQLPEGLLSHITEI